MRRDDRPQLRLLVGTLAAEAEAEAEAEPEPEPEPGVESAPAPEGEPETEEEGAPERRVAAEVAAVLGGATDELVASAPLALPLALSLCMERHEAGTEGLIAAMQALRHAVIAVSGLDARSEPVPLVVGDPRDAALALAEYLRGLLVRAARACAAAPDDLASAAAAHLA